MEKARREKVGNRMSLGRLCFFLVGRGEGGPVRRGKRQNVSDTDLRLSD